MPKFRKKPVVIEAIQWKYMGSHEKVSRYWCGFTNSDQECPHCGYTFKHHGEIGTLEGCQIVCPGDWIITGIQGEYYPCKPDIFDATYDAVEE